MTRTFTTLLALAFAAGCAAEDDPAAMTEDMTSSGGDTHGDDQEDTVGGSGGMAGEAQGGASTGESTYEECESIQGKIEMFVSENRSCDSDDDCTRTNLLCYISTPSCTGYVPINANSDFEPLNELRQDFEQCRQWDGECYTCGLADWPPRCVDSVCQFAE